MKQTELTIKNFQAGIGDSPHLGFADMRNVDIHSSPGIVKLSQQLTNYTAKSGTFTANVDTDVITINASFTDATLVTGLGVVFSSTNTLPAGLNTTDIFFLHRTGTLTATVHSTLVDALNNTSVIDITSTGTGTHTVTEARPTIINSWAVEPTNGWYYFVDSNNRLWSTEVSGINLQHIDAPGAAGTVANGNGNGLAFWKNYLFKFGHSSLYVYGPIVGTALASRSWTSSGAIWQTLLQDFSDTSAHPTWVGQDDILYYGDYNKSSNKYNGAIGSISEVSDVNFDPAVSNTFTFTAEALTLPLNNRPTCLEELGEDLMVGTSTNNIYPWRRSSLASFSLPIKLAEGPIQSMKTKDGMIYVSAGTAGNLYSTRGIYQTARIKKLSHYLTQFPDKAVKISNLQIIKGRLFFTVNSVGSSGVYSLDTDTGIVSMEHSLATYVYGTTTATTFGILASTGNGFYVSAYDSDAAVTSFNYLAGVGGYYIPSYNGYVISPLIDVGTAKLKKTYTECEIMFDKNLNSGEGAKVYYRTNLQNSWTLLATFDYATYGAEDSMNALVSATNCDSIQIKLILTTGSNSSTTPEVKSVTLR